MPSGTRPAPPVGVAKCTIRGNYTSANWENVFWCAITGSLTYSNINTFATDFYGAFQTNLLPQMDASAFMTECLVTYYDGAGNPEGSISASHAGGASGGGITAAAATVLSWKIPASWRGGKPRTYLAAPPASSLSDQRLFSDGYVASMLTSADNFLTTVNGITLSGVTAVRLGTVSFQHANAWRTPPVMFEYDAVAIQQRVCTQRRRLGREAF
jgi:hypothetical protein